MPARVRSREVHVQPFERLCHVPRVDAGADVQPLVELGGKHARAHPFAEHPALNVGAGDDDRVDAEAIEIPDLEAVRSSRQPSAVNDELCPGDERRVVREQERHCGGNVLGLPHPFDEQPVEHDLRRLEMLGIDTGDEARLHRVRARPR